MAPWHTDRELDLEGARRAIADQFPDLAHSQMEWVGSGWDNDVVRAGFWMVRFPRRRIAAHAVARDVAILELAAEALSPIGVRVPLVMRQGKPGAHFPYPFTVSRRLRGVPIHRAARIDHAHLARVLAAMHAIPVERCRQLGLPEPRDVISQLQQEVAARRSAIRSLLPADLVEICASWLAGDVEVPAPAHGAPAFVHGDLGPDHILIDDENGRVAGILDFTDAGLGDPAADLAPLIATLGGGVMAPVARSYVAGDGDATLWQRAVFLACGMALRWMDEGNQRQEDLDGLRLCVRRAFMASGAGAAGHNYP